MSLHLKWVIFTFAISAGAFRQHEHKDLSGVESSQGSQDPKPSSPPRVTWSQDFSDDDSKSLADIIHGCFNENDDTFQDCIEKTSKEKFGWTLYAIVSDPTHSKVLFSECQAKFDYGDSGKRQYHLWVSATCK